MALLKLQLTNFRNYENQYFEFSEGLNCIVGKNGSGKTNLLDAIYFLAVCKSSIHNLDSLSIRFEEDYTMVEGKFEKELIGFSLQKAGKKIFFLDKKPYEKLSDHIGKIPVVLITPEDNDLIRDGSETRRKLFDGILSQLHSEYLKEYLKYNKALDQRNSLLKQFAENQYFDGDLLSIYTEQLVSSGSVIHEYRKKFLEDFLPHFTSNYENISENKETVNIEYISDWEKYELADIFDKNLNTDLAAQRTTRGIHKDDYVFSMDRMPVKKFGSQGQKKSFIMAIRMAQFEITTAAKEMKPILLLDDIFDKLDEKRIAKLIQMIEAGKFGQVFLTDARPKRTRELLSKVSVNFLEIE
ncbi:MAG: DNA replication and repair protein RecF [Bacteroidetes bacterium]|nr:DNA replication and repair protein RecF [Bacteroidota bacterium]